MLSLRPHLKALACLILLLVILATARLFFIGTTPNGDYNGYVATAQLFSHLPTDHLYPERILKPLAPVTIALFASLLGWFGSFLFQVVGFYLALGVAFYFLGWEFFKDKRYAFIVALLGTLSYPMLRYGLDLYTETGAQFFYILSLTLAYQYLKSPTRKLLTIQAILIGIALLWKEYALVSGFMMGLILLLERTSIGEKIKNLFILGMGSLIPTIITQLLVYQAFAYTYIDWYRTGGASGFQTEYTLRNLIKSTGALLDLAWLLVPVGLREWKLLISNERKFLLLTALTPCAVFLWGYVSSRLFYILAPAFILLAVMGLKRFSQPLQYAAMVLILMANIIALALLAA